MNNPESQFNQATPVTPPAQKFCPNCGTPLQAGAMFCPQCGANLGAAVAPVAQPVTPVAQPVTPAAQPVTPAAQPVAQPVAPVAQAPAAQPVAQAPAAKFCPQCGATAPTEAMVCGSCGTPFPAPQVQSEALPMTKKEKLKAFAKKKKKLLIGIGAAILAAIVIWIAAFGIMCAVAKDKVVGSWKSEPIYLSKYGGNCVRGIVIDEDGTWICIGMRVSDNMPVFAESGTWTMEGKSAILVEKGEPGKARYTYHLNDTLTNGDTEYRRLNASN